MFSGVRILMKGKLESRAMDAASAVLPHPGSPGHGADTALHGTNWNTYDASTQYNLQRKDTSLQMTLDSA